MKILIIDDDRLTRKVLVDRLGRLNFTVITANDAFSGLTLLQHETFDLIISDLLMPSMSGLNLVTIVKQFISTNTPIIIISSLNDKDIIRSCIRLGVAHFLQKPIDFDLLISICESYDK
jgi:two-component system response regulator (stage 0 sporulation protein F)